MKSTVTFVSCFMNLYETPFENKDVEWRFNHFREIANTGIQLCVYCSPETQEYMENFASEFSNIKIMKYITIKDTQIYKSGSTYSDLCLPETRNVPKDTFEYIWLMNAKVEFLQDVIHTNPWNSTHFAWIDFNIAYIFKNHEYVCEYLRIMSLRSYADKFIAIPGCWEKQPPENNEKYLNTICWRFCGGFFIGDRESILDFYQRYLDYFPQFLETHRKLVWEVNFWAWLETNTDWSPTWYKGDHNDSIIQISADVCSRCLKTDADSVSSEYFYPPIETYLPSSAAYVYYKGRHILNTRYVNYWYKPSGHCLIHHSENHIISKNLVSILDEENMQPFDYDEMSDEIGLESHAAKFYGLEDIRLFVANDEIRFICTNINYSPTGRNRMITGKYDIDGHCYTDCRILYPPNSDSWCEKNWIPLIKQNAAGEDTVRYIYKWYPYELGEINRETDQLEIVESVALNSPIFIKVRGSTCFVESHCGLVGLVHFSEETLPRHYYHMLVLLDGDTFHPLRYSEIFCFEKIGIEFCIGMMIRNDKYYFWISQMDRDPKLVTVDVDKIPLEFEFSIRK